MLLIDFKVLDCWVIVTAYLFVWWINVNCGKIW